MSNTAKAIAAAVLAAFLFGSGWLVNGWRLTGQHAQELAQRDQQALALAEASKQIGIEANKALTAAATKAWKGLEDDKKELGRLRGCVAAGTCGVRIIAAPAIGGDTPAGAGGLGDDAIALDAGLSGRVLDLREAIGQDAAKIEYLQAYARQCWRATNGEHGPSR